MREANHCRSERSRPPLARRFSRSVVIRGASCLALLLALPSPGSGRSGLESLLDQPTGVEQGVSGAELQAWELDELYERLLADTERLAAVWKQQPGNRKALQRYVSDLRGQVARLSGSRVAATPSGQPGTTREAPATKATAEPPAGPVVPSREPSSEEEMAKRREATLERFLSGGPLEAAKARPSLAGVSSEWIAESCAAADEELAALARLLTEKSPDSVAVESSLRRLGEMVDGMGSPPAAERP